MLESGVLKDTVMVFGQMNEPPGVRLRVALTGLTMAEYFRDQGRDVLLFIEGRNLREVAAFVSERLSPLEGVLSTSTHFMLKTYKRLGVLMESGHAEERLSVAP